MFQYTIKQIIYHCAFQVRFLDLTLTQYWLPSYDWVVCLEAMEHIPQVHESTVLDNLARVAGKGILISWAVPDQPGFHHINGQTAQHVVDVMKMRNFSEDVAWSRALREAAQLTWFKENIKVFKKDVTAAKMLTA